jgi:adenosylmethionine-8-amino-7-oxononanoate aminotransferase
MEGLDALENKIFRHEAAPDEVAAVFVEPIQGEGGYVFPPPDFLRRLAEICRRHGILLAADEIQTGFGRTGKMFACEHSNVTPDILCLAKGITGGYLPLAATLTSEEVFSAFLGEYREFKTFFHGHTYTGNPLGCAAAIANLEIFVRESVVENMQPRIAFLQKSLRDAFLPLAHVSDVRQWGYMIGIELAEDKTSRKSYPVEQRMGHKVILEARQRGVMIRPLGDVIILMPPLSIGDADLTILLDVVHDCIRKVTEN